MIIGVSGDQPIPSPYVIAYTKTPLHRTSPWNSLNITTSHAHTTFHTKLVDFSLITSHKTYMISNFFKE